MDSQRLSLYNINTGITEHPHLYRREIMSAPITRTAQVHATDGTLLIDLTSTNGNVYITVEELLEAGEDLNDYVLPEPYAAGYRVYPNVIPA